MKIGHCAQLILITPKKNLVFLYPILSHYYRMGTKSASPGHHTGKIIPKGLLLSYYCPSEVSSKKKPQIPYRYIGIWGLIKAGL